MATLTPQNHAQPHERDLHNQDSTPPASSNADAAAVNHQINGHSSQPEGTATVASDPPQVPNLSSDLPPAKPVQLPPVASLDMPSQTTTVTTTATSPDGRAINETTSITSRVPESSEIPEKPVVLPAVASSPLVQETIKQDSVFTPSSTAENIGQPIMSDERNTIEKTETVLQDGTVETTVVATDVAPEPLPEKMEADEVTPTAVLTKSEEVVESPPVPAEPTPAVLEVENQTPTVVTPQAEAIEPVVVETKETVTSAPVEPLIQPDQDLLTPVDATLVTAEPSSETISEKMDVVVQGSGKVAREREEDDEDEPEAKRTKTDIHEESAVIDDEPHEGKIKLNTDVATPISNEVVMAEASEIVTPGGSTAEVTGPVDAAAEGAAAGDAVENARAQNWGPMTDAQLKALKQVIQNLRKGKNAVNFNKPVDPVALKIPTYFDIVTTPMDLSTMDKKLKENQYGSVIDFINDFMLIVDNCIKFNGAQHAVSMAAMNMKAHFGGLLKKIAKPGEEVAPAQPKPRRSSFALPAREAKRRASRPSIGAAPSPTSATTNQTFALGQDGVPLTRRTSTHDGRPKREIHKPPSRDLPYLGTKPKKKKFQMELKFCEHVLGELKRGRYADLMYPFAHPVDPVALNIPDYHKHVKKPMDFQTISEKLQNGHYEHAKEFETDVKLVFGNCYKFNGPNHPISQSGKALEAAFDDMWSNKQNWVQQNTPASAPQSPEAESGSDGEDNDEEEDEEEEEEEVDRQAELEKAAEIASLNQKIAELSAQVMGLVNSKPATKPKAPKKKGEKTKKGADSNKAKRKSSGVGASSGTPAKQEKKTPKAKPKAKPITMKEKSEIAERIGELSSEETAKAAELIKSGLRKIGRHDLADRPDEELEFDIEAIPDEVLMSLLKLVRRNDAPKETRPTSTTAKTNAPPKAKKNKPMGKHEQEDAIRRLHERIGTFQTPATGDNSGDVAVSSGDEDDSGSESEEE